MGRLIVADCLETVSMGGEVVHAFQGIGLGETCYSHKFDE